MTASEAALPPHETASEAALPPHVTASEAALSPHETASAFLLTGVREGEPVGLRVQLLLGDGGLGEWGSRGFVLTQLPVPLGQGGVLLAEPQQMFGFLLRRHRPVQNTVIAQLREVFSHGAITTRNIFVHIFRPLEDIRLCNTFDQLGGNVLLDFKQNPFLSIESI